MDVNNINAIPSSSTQPVDPEWVYLCQKIDETITEVKNAIKALDQKIDELIASIKGIVSGATDIDQLKTSLTELSGLQQKKNTLNNALNDLLDLKKQIEKLKSEGLTQACAELEDELNKQLKIIQHLLHEVF